MRCHVVALILLTACQAPGPDLDADRAELLRMHEQGRADHLEKRADRMVASFDDSILFVAHGAISTSTPEQSRVRLQAYFDRSTFEAWDDITPPVLRISPDGRMAYKLVHKRVQLTAPDSAGKPAAEHTVFAWVEIYEKPADRWILKAVASTDRPGP